MNLLITICARGGSKGIPGKNIKELHGLPLIAYTIRTAKKIAALHPDTDIALSTDSDEIIQVAAQHGLQSDYKRPEKLANDTAGKIDAIRDIWEQCERNYAKKYDYVLDMDVTSPLRTVEDIEQAFSTLQSNPQALNLFSVSPANRNPYFNMVEQKEDGFYAQVSTPQGNVFTRQSAPAVYDLNASFYIYTRDFFVGDYRGAITDRSLVYVMPHTCFDLDHSIDFDILSYLISNNKLDFEI